MLQIRSRNRTIYERYKSESERNRKQVQFLRLHGKSIPSELRYTYCFNVLSKKTDRRARHRRTHHISPRALMTTTTRLYKPDQMTLGEFEGQITRARVDEDGRQSCICALWWQRQELPHSDSVRFVTAT